jgi:hypothetical protein
MSKLRSSMMMSRYVYVVEVLLLDDRFAGNAELTLGNT